MTRSTCDTRDSGHLRPIPIAIVFDHQSHVMIRLLLIAVLIVLVICAVAFWSIRTLQQLTRVPAEPRNLRYDPIEERALLNTPPEQWAADAAAAVERAEAPRPKPKYVRRSEPDAWVVLRSYDGVIAKYPVWDDDE